jgi:hypothetical protein
MLPFGRLCFNLGANFVPATEHPSAKQVKASATIHGGLERLQSVDLTLRPPIARGFEDGIANRLDALPQCPDKASHAVDSTCAGVVQPDGQPLHRSATK